MERYSILSTFLFLAGALPGQVMFPGDANNDGTANYLDLLPVGIAYGAEGFIRPGATENWAPQIYDPWFIGLPTTLVNGGHIDANGDSVIDSLDIDAIVANYDLMQNASVPLPTPWLHEIFCEPSLCPPPVLSITYDQDTVGVSQSFQAYISLLYPFTLPPEQGALGIALELSYDPDLAVEESVEVIPNTDEEGLMFITATSVAAFGYRLPSPGRVQIAAAGRGQNAFFKDSTLVATLSIIVVDDIQRDTVFRPFRLEVENLLILNIKEEMVHHTLSNPDSVVLYQVIGAVEDRPLSGLLEVYPNPASGLVCVQAKQAAALDFLRMWSTQGHLVREIRQAEGQEWNFQSGDLPRGLYWLEAQRGGEKWVRQVMLR